MAIGAGIGAQFGIVTETTFNTYAAPSRFYEFNSEGLKYNKRTVVGLGLRAGGQVARAQRRVVSTFDGGGDVTIDLPTRGLGLLMSHATGSTPTGTVVSAGVYSYAFTLGDLYGRSFTAQVGVPQYGGTVTPKSLTGCKISSFSLGVTNGGIATGRFSIDAAGFTTAQALATASYSASTSVFQFAQGAITIDAANAANIRDFNVTVTNALKNDRYNLGGLGAKSEQSIGGFRKITGTLTAEFTDTTLLTKVLNDASAALVLTFTGATIASTYKDTLSITLPAVKFNTDVPSVSGPGPIDVAMSFEAYDDGTNQPLTIGYQTSESTL